MKSIIMIHCEETEIEVIFATTVEEAKQALRWIAISKPKTAYHCSLDRSVLEV